ncbi:hypothetical protein QVD17_36784 [Tagetes erecta]|uniref:TIR domain-containing protein n=1 Tax=Tagetes erecta TaxID=13708 RepID=A0AAD8JVE5_TARER|nr:hypothetical protein QVD17_36784 [Tagetes erecta]
MASAGSCKYDVFLSFRGEDVRKTFVDHLYSALVDKQIQTYKDDETLSPGHSIRPSLFKAIEDSRIALVIFSKTYADSSWCLDELSHIMKCKDERELIVMPVFYDVDPLHVRKQKGDFGKAFAKLQVENIDKAQVWTKALVDASNIAGWETKYVANGHESKVIKEIVDRVLDRLFPTDEDINEDLVGMTTRLKDLKSVLEIGSERVRMVGIWGGGGSGKTTLATFVYMEICHQFHGHCIVENVREESSKCGLKKLQENMLSAVLKRDVKVPSVAVGKQMIKTMLCSRNVLIILDDVNSLDQLNALAGSHKWFGSGSRIIVTTRDEHLLKTHKVDQVYNVQLLSDEEAIRLFNIHAYNENDPIEDYKTLSLRVVSYAAGLPLALKVLGSFLYDKEKKGWMSTLARLKDIPEMEIVEKLKISYDGLKNVEKELFLDIACFFRGEEKDFTMESLEACGFYPDIGIEVLRQKALITVSRDGSFDMHDLVQEMGNYIVRGQHPNNPKQHSRIWKREEIDNMYFGDATMENDKIEAIKYIHLDYERVHDYASQLCKIVSNLKRLRYLWLNTNNSKSCVEGPAFISNELRYLTWYGYTVKSPFSDGFQPVKLVVLELSESFQKEIWKGCKHLPHLKVLQLSWMKELLRTPNFDGLPRLQRLTLSYCSKLKEIHPSLGNHTSLQYVKVSNCEELIMFPTITHMENLKVLEIKLCPMILEFPKIKANMEGLVKLLFLHTGIEVLPSSIGERCTNLISLNLSSFKNIKSIQFSFHALKHLKELSLQGLIQPVKTRHQFFNQLPYRRRFNNIEIPSSIVELSNLQELNLCFNDFSRLDFSLSSFTRLKWLTVSNCEKLLELPDLPSSLTVLNASHCKSLKALGDCYKNCRWLSQVSLSGGSIINDGDRLLKFMLEVCTAIEDHYMLLQLSGVEIAKGFTSPLLRGNRCTLQLPKNWCTDFSGFLICAVMPYAINDLYVRIAMNEEMSGMDSQNEERDGDSDSVYKCTWMAYVSFGLLKQTKWWDPAYNALSFDIEQLIKCCGFGVRLLDKKSRSSINETSTNHSSGYTPNLHIRHDSSSALSICFSMIYNF